MSLKLVIIPRCAEAHQRQPITLADFEEALWKNAAPNGGQGEIHSTYMHTQPAPELGSRSYHIAMTRTGSVRYEPVAYGMYIHTYTTKVRLTS